LRVLAAGRDEIAERPEHSIAEALSSGEQCRGGGSEAHAIAFQLLERVAPRSHLSEGLLGMTTVRPTQGLLLTRLRDEMTRPLGVRSRPLGVLSERTGPLRRMIAALLSRRQLAV